ncbi:unnamed protein product [Echinostoma caproni]|uniref:Peptidase A1 domain-containing protein n=1 Tax=Echinostoma caproni TaxID=27848 RepID=A0A183A4K6_9TREM|nr:unnamed protein product [Echinostoma caproni]
MIKITQGQFAFSGIGFRVDHVIINMTHVDCKPRTSSAQSSAQRRGVGLESDEARVGSFADDNPFCTESIDVTNMLNLFSYNNYDAFCAAYVFTYRDFSGGTLGLAWVGSLSGPGGVCSKYRLLSEGSQHVHKSLNTGLVTLVNFGRAVS